MGPIIGRTRKDGSKAFVAQIVTKKAGAIVCFIVHCPELGADQSTHPKVAKAQ